MRNNHSTKHRKLSRPGTPLHTRVTMDLELEIEKHMIINLLDILALYPNTILYTESVLIETSIKHYKAMGLG